MPFQKSSPWRFRYRAAKRNSRLFNQLLKLSGQEEPKPREMRLSSHPKTIQKLLAQQKAGTRETVILTDAGIPKTAMREASEFVKRLNLKETGGD